MAETAPATIGLSLLKVTESLLDIVVFAGAAIGALGFLILGITDITGFTRIGSSSTLVGAIGLAIGATCAFSAYNLSQKNPRFHIITGALLLVLSFAFMHFSPTRLGFIFGRGDPGELAATWTAATGGLILLLMAIQKVTRRANSGEKAAVAPRRKSSADIDPWTGQ